MRFPFRNAPQTCRSAFHVATAKRGALRQQNVRTGEQANHPYSRSRYYHHFLPLNHQL